MLNDADHLKKLLSCHGTDVNEWPVSEKVFGRQAMTQPLLRAIIEAERRFEQLMHERHMPQVSMDLVQRIVTTARARPQKTVFFMSEILKEVRPATWAAMLILGFTIGFGIALPPHTQGPTVVQYTFDEDGAIL